MKQNRKKWLTALLCLALLLFTGAYAGFSHYFNLLQSSPALTAAPDPEPSERPGATPEPMETRFTPAPTPTPEPENRMPDVYNLLLLGVDASGDNYYTRTDTMMMVSLVKNKKEILLTSFLRDTYVYIPDWGYQRLNAANTVGGPEKTIETIRYHFGVEADNYVFVNFKTFVDTLDRLGGVDIDLTNLEVDYINARVRSDHLDYSEDGRYHLTGAQALSFCRNRSIGSDLRRTEQQRRLIAALWEKLSRLSPGEVSRIAEEVLSQIVTDLDRKTFLSLLLTIPSLKNYTVEQQQIPAEGTFRFSTIGGASVIEANADANREILRKRLEELEE